MAVSQPHTHSGVVAVFQVCACLSLLTVSGCCSGKVEWCRTRDVRTNVRCSHVNTYTSLTVIPTYTTGLLSGIVNVNSL